MLNSIVARLVALAAAILVFSAGGGDAWARDYTGARLSFDFATFAGTGFSPTPTVGQLNSTTWQVGGLSTGDVTYRATVTSGDAARGGSRGGVTVGGIYAFQVSSEARAFGFQATDPVMTPGAITMRLVNATGRTIRSVAVGYDLWVYNDGGVSTSITLEWSTDGTTWFPIVGSEFQTPQEPEVVPGWASRRFELPIHGISWAPDQALRVRWFSDDHAGLSGRDEIGINAVSFWETTCGDEVIDPGEECEPLFSGRDVCDDDCTFAECGDGTANGRAGEECDDPSTPECDDDCTVQHCGDGFANPHADEDCDAGAAVLTGSLGASNSTGSVDGSTLLRAQVFELASSSHLTAVHLVLSSAVSGGCAGATVSILNTTAAGAPNQGSVRAVGGPYQAGTATNGWIDVYVPFDVTLPGGRYAILFDPEGMYASCVIRAGTNNPYPAGKAWTTTLGSGGALVEFPGSGTDLDFEVLNNVFDALCNDDCTPAVCGDLVVNTAAGETCDEGRATPTCDSDCTGVECGDGVRNAAAGEACDTAGDTDICDGDCTAVRCGDLRVNEAAGETCEDGNSAVGDGCDAECVAEVCGNGKRQTGEACDGGGVDTETCNVDCTAAACGDGYVNLAALELCDEGGSTETCDGDCTPVKCGDGYTNRAAGEACDTRGADTEDCNADCSAAVCGDGYLNRIAGEQCDDGNTVGSDGCSADCRSELCGDGALQRDLGEQCDDGNQDNGDGCDATCFFETCGNNRVQDGEECDEGAETADCDGDCTFVECGDGTRNIVAGEECDDGDLDDGDGCTSACVVEECGDGIMQSALGEECDDGNQLDGDGCEADCTFAGDAGADTGMDSGPDAGADTGGSGSTGGSRRRGGCTAAETGGPGLSALVLGFALAAARRRRC